MIKKYIINAVIFFFIISLSCSKDNSTNTVGKGKLIINSNPSNASIYISDKNTNKITPDSIELDKGTYSVKLKLKNYIESGNSAVIESNKTTVLNVDLKSINTSINIELSHNAEQKKLFFNFKFNIDVKLESVQITRPTIDNGNYVTYTESFNNSVINSNLTYRVPQNSMNDFEYFKGIYTFIFVGSLNEDSFEKEETYQIN